MMTVKLYFYTSKCNYTADSARIVIRKNYDWADSGFCTKVNRFQKCFNMHVVLTLKQYV